jgi:sulfide:quinone oxidoreductase
VAKSVLILGGGFGGVEAAIFLRKQGLDVTLVSNRPYLFMYPTSIWVATGETAFEDVCVDLAGLARVHGFRFLEGTVEAIDGAHRRVTVDGATHSADYVIVAIGGAKMRPKGVERTYTPCGDPSGSVALQKALSALIEHGSGRIAIGFGGNPNVDTLLRRRGLRAAFTLTFFAPMAVPGQRMGTRAVQIVEKLFARQGIASRYGKKIVEFDERGVVLEGGGRIDADLTVFIPAGDGHPVVRASDLPRNEAGFVRIDGCCEVVGRDGVYAVGDAAALEGPEWRAKQGHIAEVMARTAASNIAHKEAAPRSAPGGRPLDEEGLGGLLQGDQAQAVSEASRLVRPRSTVDGRRTDTARTAWLTGKAGQVCRSGLDPVPTRNPESPVAVADLGRRLITFAASMLALFVALLAAPRSSIRSRLELEAEILALRHQLAVLQDQAPERPRLPSAHQLVAAEESDSASSRQDRHASCGVREAGGGFDHDGRTQRQ